VRANTKFGSKKNILSHYDLGNDFYSLWLDPTMTYSSSLRINKSDTLEEAQINKYKRIIDRLDINNDTSVLEIGSGWEDLLN
jgi:cyclopropane-fatty-acyl-phospholipid synthase